MALVCRHWWAKAFWLLWPAWVWFAVMATGNHFWLDFLAGHRRRAPRGARRLPPRRSCGACAASAGSGADACHRRRRQVTATPTGAPAIASRVDDRARAHPSDPDRADERPACRCASLASVLVYFEYRNELLFFWLGAVVFVLGSILDILDGALARAGGKATPFGAFLDSTTDRVGEAFMLGAIGLVFAPRRERDGSRCSPSRRSPARSSSRTRAPARRRSASKATSASARGPSGWCHLPRPRAVAPWGGLQWAIYVLAATAWITVVQRVWFVRKQLRRTRLATRPEPLPAGAGCVVAC